MFLSSKGFGSAMIITGTSVGAGMLAIPPTVASNGFWIAAGLLIMVWIVMLSTALLLVEVNLSMPVGSNFSRMAQSTLGRSGQVITWIAYLLLLYSLTSAYTAGGGNVVGNGFAMGNIYTPDWLNSLLFMFCLGIFVCIGTAAVDYGNKILMLIKFTAFFAFSCTILPKIQFSYINTPTDNINYIWMTFPILITSFGFHHIIPTLRSYVQSDRTTLRRAVILGSLIPLLIYILWVFITLGSIPLYGESSFYSIINNSSLTAEIISNSKSEVIVSSFAYTFESVAVTTSFLGVTLGLFDFNRDTYRLQKPTIINKAIICVITFFPPFLFSVFYPNGFRVALGYASIFVAILLIGLPAVMAWIVRNRLGYNTLRSKLLLLFILFIAALMIVLEVATVCKILPNFM